MQSQIFIIGGVIALLIILTIVGILTRYRKCRSDEVLVVYGKTSGKASAKCYHGGAAFVWPVIQGWAIMDMKPMQIQCDLQNALSQQKIEVNVPTVVTVAISERPEIMQNAAVRLLGLSQDDKIDQIKDVIWGQMRLVIAEMTVEQLISDRDTFLGACKKNITEELEKFGLTLLNINISDITDNAKYIINLGKKAATEAQYNAEADMAEKIKDGEVRVATQEQEKAVRLAEIQKEQDTKVAANDKERQTVVANTEKDRDIQLQDTEKEKNVGIAEKQKEETVRRREIKKDESVQVSEFEKEEKVKTREIEKNRNVETATLSKDEATQVAEVERDKEVQVATAQSEQAQKVAEQEKLKNVAIAQQEALTASETATANAQRDAVIAEKIAESKTAQQKATQESEASIVEFQQEAEARKETASQQAEAKKRTALQEKESKIAEAVAGTQKRTAIANKDAKVTENNAGIEVAKSDAALGKERAEADQIIGESRANSDAAVGIAKAEAEAKIAKAQAEAERQKQTADIMVSTQIEADRKKTEAEGIKQKAITEAEGEAEAIIKKAQAEAEATKIKMLAEAEGKLAIAEALAKENAAKTADAQALLETGKMSGAEVVQFYSRDVLADIARADAEKFEHIHLGQVTVLGGTDTVPDLLQKVVKGVSSVNTLKDNIPGVGGLFGLVDSWERKQLKKQLEESSKDKTRQENDPAEPEEKK